jgi:signal transduction histidine kinase
VIADFLQFARPTELSMEPVDPAVIIAAALDAASVPADVRVEVDVRPDVQIRADAVLLKQCLINLIRNAVDAMEGRGTLTLRALPEGRWLHLEVSDTGPGIDEEMKDRLFLPFVTSKPDGTGLGLAIVQKIAVLHEGAVEAESTGEGTTFRLILLLADGRSQESGDSSP